jgi:hypothetical protein
MVKIFISHCSEDKNDVARPLATALVQDGYEVWFDEPIIGGGDSIFEQINEGLKITDYGIVIFSESFFKKKKWPMMELDALIAKETDERKIIIPIWHRITSKEMINNFPLLANRKGLSTDIGISKIVEQIIVKNQTFITISTNSLYAMVRTDTHSKTYDDRSIGIKN